MARGFRIPAGAIKVPVPNIVQETNYSCGPSSLRAICNYYGFGPYSEKDFIKAMNFDHRVGANPDQVVRAARRFGLDDDIVRPMLFVHLISRLKQRHPVMCMIQAYGRRDKSPNDYVDGHWVVGIGYDERGVYFEDPSMGKERGFLTYPEFQARWHDTGPRDRHLPFYGVALWKRRPKYRQPQHLKYAMHIP
jgi:predicted double-glycine peptidase